MLVILMIIGAVVLRLVPHIPNFAPITAMALFGGVYLEKRWAILIPFLTMAISDYLLGSLFHSTTFYVWSSFLVSSLIGIWLRDHKKPQYIISASIFASIQFFIITNFGVWTSGMYSRGFDGLIQSYMMGIPFFRWTLLGDLFYSVTFFGIYELATTPMLRVGREA